MSQFTLTQEEDAMVLTALRDNAARYAAMFGVADPALEAVIAKVEGQLPQPEVEEPAPVATPVAEPEVAVETPQEEKPAKAKKAKAKKAKAEEAAE